MNKKLKKVLAAALILEEIENYTTKPKRTIWARKFFFRGDINLYYENLIKDLSNEGEQFFKRFGHITQGDFTRVCDYVHPLVKKQNTNMRIAISVGERVAVTLKYLACGDSRGTLSELFRISPQAIYKIIPEVCEAIFLSMKHDYLKIPATESEWRNIAEEFNNKWNFPNCLGAVDGKHVICKCPPKAGSSYFNYKGSHSIVLMAVAKADGSFIYVNIGAKGSASDGGVFLTTSMYEAMHNERNPLNIPPDQALPGCQRAMPFVIIADDAFAESTRLIKPIPGVNLTRIQKVFNYRISRARRIIESAFGIAASRWRVLRKPIEVSVANTEKIVAAVCVLHNFFMHHNHEIYASPENLSETLGNSLLQLKTAYSRRSEEIQSVRNEYINYFLSPLANFLGNIMNKIFI